MNWEQKLETMMALGACELIMRKPGDWYVNQDVSLQDGRLLVSEYGNGTTPQEAVENHFDGLALGSSPKKYLVIRDDGGRRHVYWNGYRWVDVK